MSAPIIVAVANSIEWTDRSWNPGVWGCEKAGPECLRCYAMSMGHRLSAQGVYPVGITRSPGLDDKGAQWTGLVLVSTAEHVRASAAEHLPKRPRKDGRNWRIFTTSMGDLFHKDVPFWWLDVVFEEMAARPWIDFQVLTKRSDRMFAYDCDRRLRGLGWPSNVWAGVTTGTQKGVDERVPYLLKVCAAVRFLSCEPLLEALDLDRALRIAWHCQRCDRYFAGRHQQTCPGCSAVGYWTGSHAFNPPHGQVGPGVHMVITGCESGTKPRQTDPGWYRQLRDQCSAAGVAFFLKQADFGNGIESLPLLDGRQWAQFPESA